MRLNTPVIVGMWLFLLGFLSACDGGTAGGEQEANGGLTTVRIAPWGPKFIDFIDFYVAEELGYLADAGIRLEQLSAEGAGDAVRYVVAGNADIAMADPFSGYFAIQQGADIQGFYCPYPKSWMKLVVNTAKGIREPADLKGKTLAVTSQASTSRYYAMFFLAANGLSEDDVTMASVGRDFASVLLGGTVDAASTWDSINWAMFQRGGDPQEQGFAIWDYEQVPGPNDIYFARRSWLQENEATAGKLITAIQKAKHWIANNPEQAVEIGARHALGADNPGRNRAIIDMRIDMQSSGPGVAANGIGWCDPESMQAVADQAVTIGILRERIDIASVITNRFLTEDADASDEEVSQ